MAQRDPTVLSLENRNNGQTTKSAAPHVKTLQVAENDSRAEAFTLFWPDAPLRCELVKRNVGSWDPGTTGMP